MIQAPSWSAAGLVLAAHAAVLLALGSAPMVGSGNAGKVHFPSVMQVRLLPAVPPSEATAAPLQPTLSSGVPPRQPVAPRALAMLSAPALQGAHYRLPQQLGQGPQLIHDVAPDLGYLALPFGPVQSAVLRLLINERGDIDQITVLQSQLSEAVLQEVQKAYANLKFMPGRVGDLAVKSQLIIEVRLENNFPGV